MTTADLRPDSHGKVRDIYDCGDALLMVASDRISAYDFVLPDEIPQKGEVRPLCRSYPQPHDFDGSCRFPRALSRLRGLSPGKVDAGQEGRNPAD